MSYLAVAFLGFLVLSFVFAGGIVAGLTLAVQVMTRSSGERLEHRIAAHVAARIMDQRAAAEAKRGAN
jgi:hypothetical protein